MFCKNCEFEIKGEDRKECPVCGGPLIEYSELKISLDESKSDSEAGKLEETIEESKEPAFFDLESALNADDEAPVVSAQEPKPVFKKRSKEDILANPLKKPDPIEEFVSTATKKSELKQKHSSKLLPVIVVMGVLIIAVQIGGIFFLKSQQKLNPLIVQLKKETREKADKILNTIMGKEKEKALVEKDYVFVDSARTAQEEISQEKTASVKEIPPPVILKKDVKTPQMKVVPKITVKKEETPVKAIEEKASSSTIYSIHAGSYKTEKVAVSESSRLKQLGFDAYVQTTDLQKGQIWHRVKIGGFSTRKDAQKVQNELRQKDSKLKSVIVKRKAKSRKTLVKKEEKKSIVVKKPVPVGISQPVQKETSKQKPETIKTIPPVKEIAKKSEKQPLNNMELAPDITQPVQKETSQQKPDAIKTTPSINEAIKADEEQPVAEMETASDVSQPVEGEVVQRETDSVERTLPIDKTVTTGEEQPLAEMETASDVLQPVKEEVSQQKPDTVKTVTAVIPAKNDHPFAVNVPPESAVNKEEEIVTSAEMNTYEKVVYSINANSYKIKRIAVDEVIRLKLLGFDDVYIRTDDLGEGEIWYRIMIGKFNTREDAQKVQDELRQKDAKLKSVIIKLESEPT
ncbi:MAG: SPOR domain-containing protein [Deltaproteobacteria bacterium]|nr:SPOR domain-containing protein [Deltaproteobacteria bacterium]